MDISIEIAGETLTLMPERAAYWARTRTLFIADTHFGKAASFMAGALAFSRRVAESSTADDLARLDRALARTGAQKLIILGDFFHARGGRAPSVMDALSAWRAAQPDLAIYNVRGNHDRHAGDPPDEWHIQIAAPPTPGPVFVLCHEPIPPERGYALAGHLHPAIQMVGAGRQAVMLPCFWFGAKVGVLPSFGGFTGFGVVTPARGDQVYVIADDQVMRV
jgi:DNA ligase-associated metallophosphoesterase